MGDRSKIEWTDATWNPTVGCTKVSSGCDHCYAERITNRFGGPGAFDTVTLRPERLDQPLRWKLPRRVFVDSMSDLFHDEVPDDYVARVFAVMALAPMHTFQILTKRHARMRSLLNSAEFWRSVGPHMSELVGAPAQIDKARALPNVWLGVSVEDQKWARIRIPALVNTPAAVRFLSCEPLLGPIDLRRYGCPVEVWDGPYRMRCSLGGDGNKCAYHGEFTREVPGEISWVIVGGESGPEARPMHPDWARSLRDQCQQAGVAFFLKQWGEWIKTRNGMTIVHRDGEITTRRIPLPAGAVRMARVGKKAAGRELDGRTWDEMPAVS